MQALFFIWYPRTKRPKTHLSTPTTVTLFRQVLSITNWDLKSVSMSRQHPAAV
jgi:hypothetical protein